MNYCVAAILLLLLPSLCNASRLNLKEVSGSDPPKNAHIKYGGLLGCCLDVIKNQLHDQANQYISLRYNAGLMTFGQFNEALEHLNYRHAGGLAWYDLLPPEQGGLPSAITIIRGGLDHDLLSNPLFRLDYKLGFKFTEHEFKAADWSFRFSPNASFNLKNLVRSIGCSVYIDYDNLVEFETSLAYVRKTGWQLSCSVNLMKW